MTDCPLEQLPADLPAGQAGRWWCPLCDPQKKRLLAVNARRNCRNSAHVREVAGELGITERLAHYAVALTRWLAAGRPIRSDAEVAHIHSHYCCPCRDYDARREVCTICGCKTRREGQAVRNKIRMATERCPKGKW